MIKKHIYKLAFMIISLHAGAAVAVEAPTSWTSWLNRDLPGGAGDYESRSLFPANQVCAAPTAVQARIRGTTTIFVPGNATPHKLSNFSPLDGLVCQNAQQTAGTCGDYEVRFNCPPVDVATNTAVVIKKVTTLKLPALRDGKNSVAFVELTPESRAAVTDARLTVNIDGQAVNLNDLKEGLDAVSRDGIFTGLTNVNETELATNDEFFQRKLQTQASPQVIRFDGRSVLGRQAFTSGAKSPATTVVLADGTQAKVLDSAVANSGDLPALTNAAHTLAIRDPKVVAHPSFTFDPCNTDGKGNSNPNADWSFKTLISNLNNPAVTGLTNQQFAHKWLINWLSTNNVNGFAINARPNIKQYFPGWDGVNASTLNMDRLPFRLLAITNRMDLAKSSAYGSNNKPGETRFVFGILQLNQTSCTNGGLPSAVNNMTVIFEYGDTALTCSTQQSRAKQWIELDALAGEAVPPSQVGANIGSAAYMSALKVITDAVTVAGANRLNQLRTNDFAFDGVSSLSLPWQLREFAIDKTSRLLVPTTIKQTPNPVQFRDGSNVMAAFAEQNANAILCESHNVPAIFSGAPFLGASADYSPNSAWVFPTLQSSLPAKFPACYKTSVTTSEPSLTTADLLQSEVRHKFSLNTCDDCHARETGTSFTHINSNRSLSGFMTGITVTDPLLGGAVTRQFDDLGRRNQVLSEMAVQSCNVGILKSRLFKNARLNMVH